ncbi:hypothetical protein N665_0049s0001 [Sinapis alba]|nr:hypothetical protein N665_0049s0001 [Sinapis alba]
MSRNPKQYRDSSCPVSCKLIHGLLSRQLISKTEYTLWSVFGNNPIRFSLEEFWSITGLNCGEFPAGYDPPDHNSKDANKQKDAHNNSFWRIRLALIIIVDGVLIASQQVHRPTLRYVKMLENVDDFLEFPWGRESFIRTVRCMKPPMFDKGKHAHDPVGMLVQKLKQETFRLTRFPLALQLLAFRAIPMLQSKIPAPFHENTILDLTAST